MVLVVRRGVLRSGAVMGFGGREVVVKVATAVRLAARGRRRGRGQGSSVKRPVVERPRGPRARGCLLWPGRLAGLHPRRFPDSRFQTPRLDASGAGRGLGQDLGLYATGPIALPQPGWVGGSAYGGTAGRRAMQARPGQCTMRKKQESGGRDSRAGCKGGDGGESTSGAGPARRGRGNRGAKKGTLSAAGKKRSDERKHPRES